MIGANIRKWRLKKGISQDKLSKLSDLSLNTVVKIESGRNSNPTVKTLAKIASSLHVKVDDLLIVIALIFFLLPFSGTTVNGQEPEAEERNILSLEDSVQMATKNNKDIQMQEQEVVAARADITGARSDFLPNLNVSAGYTRNEAVAGALATGDKDAGVFTGYKNDNTLGAGIRQIVYNGGANIANFNTAKLNLRAQEETLRAQKLDVEFEARRLYYGLLLAIETERIAQELVNNAQDHYVDVKNRYRQGLSSKFDLLQSKVQVALLMPQLVKAKNSIDLIRAEFKKLLGLSQSTELSLKDEKLKYRLIDIKEDEFLQIAYLNKPEMILKALGVDINKWSIQMAKSGWRPQVNADLNYNFRSDSLGNMINNNHSLWNAGFSVSFPLFDGFASKAKVDAAKARYKKAVLSKENMSDQIAVDIKQACLDLKQALAIIDSQKDNVFAAREALRIAIVSYDNGEAKNLDVMDAQVSLGQVQQNLYEGIYDYLMAQAELDRNLGKSCLPVSAEKSKTENLKKSVSKEKPAKIDQKI